MALNLSAIKSLPQQILAKFKGAGASNDSGASSGLKQLYLQIAFFIIFALLAFWVISEVRVNGPVYNKIKEKQDLVADALPPPLYPVDAFAAYNQAYVASANFNNDKRDKALANAAKFETLFNERSVYWAEKLKGTSLEKDLDMVIKSGNNFFTVAKRRLIPALPLGTVAASAPLSELTSAFELTQIADNVLMKKVEEENTTLIEQEQKIYS